MTCLASKFLVPLNRAALMNQTQHLVSVGYHYFNTGSVSVAKASGLLDKFAALYPILATPSQRSTNHAKRIANVELLWSTDPQDPHRLCWTLLATKGRMIPGEPGFPDPIHQRERMKDARLIAPLWDSHYQLHQRLLGGAQDPDAKARKRGAKLRWTWSMTRETFAGWASQVRQAAHVGDRAYQTVFSNLTPSPLYGGIRADLRELERIGYRAWLENHRRDSYRMPLPCPLPSMPRIQVYGRMTLEDLIRSAS